jgi:hypothetical protein
MKAEVEGRVQDCDLTGKGLPTSPRLRLRHPYYAERARRASYLSFEYPAEVLFGVETALNTDLLHAEGG